MNPLVELGYAECQALTRVHAKSFSLASHLLRGERRKAAFALYAFCRRLDDFVDLEDPGHAGRRLDEARALVTELFAGRVSPAQGWPVEERLALEDTIARFSLPRTPFDELLDGMEMDLSGYRYRTVADLDLYCHRVAGTVGELMAPILGYENPAAPAHAELLGRAMQRTNILRDVREDLERGRLYLPEEELDAFGVRVTDLRALRRTPELDRLIAQQVANARTLYVFAELGIPMLGSASSRMTVRVMSQVYGGILDVIERRGHDVLRGRARLSAWGKAGRLLRAVFTRSPPLALPASTTPEVST